MPIANIASVQQHGVLSHERASKLPHHSIALQPVQDKRDLKTVPGGRKLHQYANLYFHARNPMMFKRKSEAADICVLRVSTNVFALAGAVITDMNAASNYVRFYHPTQWASLDFNAIFAMDWRHPDNAPAYYRHSAQKCAEVLIPGVIAPAHIEGAYVVDAQAETKLRQVGFALPIAI
ncbi:MAG TPA: DUF4433 domain-containing protein, partial [Rhizomicrobium sp.]|nr:DUF4433 domain-containing protein [Rhizomicrobium sp.]